MSLLSSSFEFSSSPKISSIFLYDLICLGFFFLIGAKFGLFNFVDDLFFFLVFDHFFELILFFLIFLFYFNSCFLFEFAVKGIFFFSNIAIGKLPFLFINPNM